MQQLSPLASSSPEILIRITMHAVDELGPPQEWLNLVLCCSALQRQLDNSTVHALVFARKFYRLRPAHPLAGDAKGELRRRFGALKVFRRACVDGDGDGELRDALRIAHGMLHDEAPGARARTVAQLRWAGLPRLLVRFLEERWARDARGWPVPSETHALVVALLWLLAPEPGVHDEPEDTRRMIMDRIRPFALAASKYPLEDDIPTPAESAPFPGLQIYSILCYFARLDFFTPTLPPHLRKLAPAPAPATHAAGRADAEHFISQCRARRCDARARVPAPGDRGYRVGSLAGQWQGSSLIPCIDEYKRWVSDAGENAPGTMTTFSRVPLYVTLREHFSTAVVDRGEGAAGLFSSWKETEHGIVTSDASGKQFFYKTYHDAKEQPSSSSSITDVVVTGQTDDPYASAWGSFKFLGRIRLADGLVTLQRESLDGHGTTLFKGYLVSGDHFAGRYREFDGAAAAAGVTEESRVAEWEAAFSLSRVIS
ncbi:unnamed protein product [Mycena citricolor]|uniref:Uncharacterized protein n=1 Tax=Mycena citricolor TaxID=2018698 RepID=A0AAD2HB38_9AGAR|nr:unnamed protein product [Mycena citricolor]